jgi:hypothetical protein
MVYVRDPAHNLSPLRQAFYILKCVSDGRTRKEIVEEFDGDEQLVSIWINYLMERNYLNTFSVSNAIVHVPNPISLTLIPLFPNFRYFI